MQLRRTREKKIPMDMTPMIDVVFQLLVFFLFTFKIIQPEGEIAVNMPPITAGSSVTQDPPDLTKVPIRLLAAANGSLGDVRLGDRSLGNDLSALTESLKRDFGALIGPKDSNLEIEVDAERMLHYYWVIRATNAIMRAGVVQINFTDPKAKG